MWYHFEFTSGANPYIAFTEEKAKEMIRKMKRKKYLVEEIVSGFYRVYDN